ncbi:MAG: hypothetical protein ACE5GY_08430 [Thermodesulfobacteriota bacterium]
MALVLSCLALASCAAGVRHYYPPSIGNMSRNELVRLNSGSYPLIEAIDGNAIGSYNSPLYILPGGHRITLRPGRPDVEADPLTIFFNARAGDIYRLSYDADWSGQGGRSGTWSARVQWEGTSPPPPHPVLLRFNGLVYLYREDKVFGPGTDLVLPIFLNGKILQYLYPGSLCPLMIKPGPAAFSVAVGGRATLVDVAAGGVYYVKGGISMSHGAGFTVVDEEQGEKEIRRTWVNALCHEVPRGYYPLVEEPR